MAYQDLRDFLARLERAGELKRISAEVDVDLEITEITDRVRKPAGRRCCLKGLAPRATG